MTSPEKKENSLWLCDHLQYVRMLAELLSVGIPPEVTDDLKKSMDLTEKEIMEIFSRAEREWEWIKLTAPYSFNPEYHLKYLDTTRGRWVLVNHESYKAVHRENDELKGDNRELRQIVDNLFETLKPYCSPEPE